MTLTYLPIEFLKHPRSVGAIAPSGRALAKAMVDEINFAAAGTLVEFGPGTGVFTALLVERKRPETRLLAIEQNERFCDLLRERFKGHENVEILHAGAETLLDALEQRGIDGADAILSGLPFASLPTAVSERILEAARVALTANGPFVTFQYSLVKAKLFAPYFDLQKRRRVWRNLPPAHVLRFAPKR